jgi:hypothetical protein|tara:strand:+ start:1750 stop:2055 length:306 start_codon:yes stop_codon:yes gene_type:complete
MIRLIILFLIFLLILSTTVTKNSTKKLDKEIFQLDENIRLLRNKYDLIQLEYNYLSSPSRLNKLGEKYFKDIFINKDIKKFGKIMIDPNKNIINQIQINEE